uniref:Uncharacterized protein n=1 Tax=Candidatus Methanogaster sp. ANME-2c ERB4 TaxID=2759911 RepID=A0A7G9YG27_9EURY|nr:hypothetical protein CLAIAILK_00022 [Methanosarcinales archaeon ANME-2c ERB4]
MKTDTTEHETNGRKTVNAALIALLRAIAIAAFRLVLGAGASSRSWSGAK